MHGKVEEIYSYIILLQPMIYNFASANDPATGIIGSNIYERHDRKKGEQQQREIVLPVWGL